MITFLFFNNCVVGEKGKQKTSLKKKKKKKKEKKVLRDMLCFLVSS